MVRAAVAERAVVLPGAPRSAGQARQFLHGLLADSGVVDDDVVDTATLLLSELVTNAVLHAGTAMTVRATVTAPASPSATPGVLVEVTDGSALLPRPRLHHVEAVTGRGLELVELFAEQWGVASTPAGKTVWFSLAGAGTPARADPSDAPASPTVKVLLCGLPAMLYSVLQEHNESVLREYELTQLDADQPLPVVFSRPEIAAAARARVHIASAIRDAPVRHAGSGAVTSPRADVTVQVPLADLAAYESLIGVLEAAESAALAGILLTRPALPELLHLRDWVFGEVVSQLHGEAVVPWTPAARVSPSAAPPVATDLGWVRRTPRAVVVADDANRIIAVSDAVAGLLGWAPDDLAGHRITAIIPAHLREAHVVGFTRQLVSGRETLIGRVVEVPALHRDGHEVAVALRLERVAVGDRTIYVGWLSPA